MVEPWLQSAYEVEAKAHTAFRRLFLRAMRLIGVDWRCDAVERVYSNQWILASELNPQACNQLVGMQLRQIRLMSGDQELFAKSTVQYGVDRHKNKRS